MGNMFAKSCKGQSLYHKMDSTVILSNVVSSLNKGSDIVMGGNPVRCYAASLPGYHNKGKPNQDRVLLHHDEPTNTLIAGIFDGHGKEGHLVSDFVQKRFLHHLLSATIFEEDPLTSMHLALSNIQMELTSTMEDVCTHSGTTVIVALLRGDKLYAINVGDSRMFKLMKGTESMFAENITKVHCPDHEEEKRRIMENGGHVQSLRNIACSQSISRVFGDKGEGGLAMSRSIGDNALHQYGVSSEPDLLEIQLTEETFGLLVGSDGLTTCFGMSRCFKEILSETIPLEGLHKLMMKCYRYMFEESKRTYADDISGIFLQLTSLDLTNSVKIDDRIPE